MAQVLSAAGERVVAIQAGEAAELLERTPLQNWCAGRDAES